VSTHGAEYRPGAREEGGVACATSRKTRIKRKGTRTFQTGRKYSIMGHKSVGVFNFVFYTFLARFLNFLKLLYISQKKTLPKSLSRT
jgi:hypothetical protein